MFHQIPVSCSSTWKVFLLIPCPPVPALKSSSHQQFTFNKCFWRAPLREVWSAYHFIILLCFIDGCLFFRILSICKLRGRIGCNARMNTFSQKNECTFFITISNTYYELEVLFRMQIFNELFCDVSSSSFAESSEIDRYQYLKILCCPEKR